MTMAANEPSCCCGVTLKRRKQCFLDRCLSSLSGLTDGKMKDHSLAFLMQHFAFDHAVVHFEEESGRDLTYFFTPAGGELVRLPPDGSQTCCLLLRLILCQQVASVRRIV